MYSEDHSVLILVFHVSVWRAYGNLDGDPQI